MKTNTNTNIAPAPATTYARLNYLAIEADKNDARTFNYRGREIDVPTARLLGTSKTRWSIWA